MSFLSFLARTPLSYAFLNLSGFFLTYLAYWPGLMTSDSTDQLHQAQAFSFNDWHPPIMAWVWSLTDSYAPGPVGLFVLLLLLYWGSFFLISAYFYVYHKSWAFWALFFPFMPFLIQLSGTLWKDMLVAGCFLGAFALILVRDALKDGTRESLRESGQFFSRFLTILFLGLILIGNLARHNALLASAPLLLAWFFPLAATASFKRFFLSLSAMVLAVFIVTNIAQKGFNRFLNTQPARVINALFIFDLVGLSAHISHNLVPGTWSPDQQKAITKECYNPSSWNDLMWGKCRFIGENIQASGLWEKKKCLFLAWMAAIQMYPLAYFKHRLAYAGELFRPQLAYLLPNTIDTLSYTYGFRPNGFYHSLIRVTEVFNRNSIFQFLFTIGFWMIAGFILWLISLFSFFRSPGPGPHYKALLLSTSAVLYTLPLMVVGVAGDFRYVYWTAMATGLSLLFLLSAHGSSFWTPLASRLFSFRLFPLEKKGSSRESF